MIDTYWSDHCRHTTFGTVLDDVADRRRRGAGRPSTATWRCATSSAVTPNPSASWTWALSVPSTSRRPASSRTVDESEEINACTVKVNGRCRRRGPGLALPLQERDAQPSHRDRALRRCRHLRGRRHPRPALRPQLRVPGHARHRRSRPHGPRFRDACRQASAAQARDHRCRRLLQLRQPDRSCHRSGQRAISPRLHRQAHGGRRCRGRHSGFPRAPRVPRTH